MAMQPVHFQILSPEQAMPAFTGARKMQDIISSALANAQQMAQLRTLPESLEQALENQRLQNQMAKVQAQYAPSMTQAELEKLQASAPYIQAQTKGILEGDIPYKQAQTDFTREETRFLPLKNLIDAISKENRGSRFGPSYELYRTIMAMPAAARATWIAENQEQWNNTLKNLADKTQQEKDTQSNKRIDQLLNKYYGPTEISKEDIPRLGNAINIVKPDEAIQPTTLQQQLDSANQQTPQASNIAQTNVNVAQPQSNIAPPKLPFRSDKDLADKVRLANQMAANKGLTTTYTQKQAEAAAKLENWLQGEQPEYSRAINNIIQYAGLKGKGKIAADIMKKENPQAYQDLQWFKNSFAPSAKALITQMEGASITNKQQELFSKMLNNAIDNITIDPASAREQINRLMSTLASISKQRVAAGQPIFKGVYAKAFGYKPLEVNYLDSTAVNAPPRSNYKSDQIAAEMKKRGLI